MSEDVGPRKYPHVMWEFDGIRCKACGKTEIEILASDIRKRETCWTDWKKWNGSFSKMIRDAIWGLPPSLSDRAEP